MKNNLFLLILLLLPAFAFNQSITWNKIYNKNTEDWASSIKSTIDNGYIVASTSGYGDTTDVWILKLDEYGDTLWTKTYGDEFSDGACSIIETKENDYVISGYKSPSYWYFDFYIHVFKIDENGNSIWEYSYPGGNRMGYDIIETFDGGYVIVGINIAMCCDNVLLLKLDKNGEKLWSKNYNYNGALTLMYEIQQTQDTGFILVGEKGNNYDQDIYIMKTDRYGDTTWTKQIDYNNFDAARSVKQLNDGNYIIAANGGSDDYGYNHLLTYKLNTAGEIIWSKSFYGNASFNSNSIILTSDEGFLTVGNIYQQVGAHGLFVFKQNFLGDSIWSRIYQKGAYGGATEACKTNDGGCVVGGYVSYNGPGTYKDVWVLKLDENGFVDIHENIFNENNNLVNIYPNPAKEFAYCDINTLNFKENKLIIKIYSLDSKLIKKLNYSFNSKKNNKIQLDISGIKNGVYIVKFESDKEIFSKKLIIN